MLGSPKTGQAALQYGTTAGDPALRRLTARRLALLDGQLAARRAYSPDRMIITNGSQQMLYMVTEALCDPGDIVLVEDPSYFVYLGILQSHGVRARGIRMETDGLDLGRLEAVLAALKRSGDLRRVKLLYLVSYYQNPTGRTTSFVKKAGALELLRRFEAAAGHPIYLLEDAAYRELRFGGDDVRSGLTVKGQSGRVIYAGTYSKPFATGVRVGFGLMPEPVFTTVMRIKGNHDFGSSNLLQQLLAQALSSGRYEKHLAALRRRYAHKARLMRAALEQHFPAEVEWWEPAGGLYFWARLPQRLKSGYASKVFQQALANNVLYVPGVLCYADDPSRRKPNHEMRLSFGGATEVNVRKGIARLGAVLRACL
jgi:2-aminoadipate transaminase